MSIRKHYRSTFIPRLHWLSSSPFELVHSDIWGPFRGPNLTKFRYFVVFMDDYTRVTFLYLMESCNDLFSVFKQFDAEIHTPFKIHIKTFSSDGLKYISNVIKEYFSRHDIIHETSCAYTPQQNGIAESTIIIF